MQLAPILPLDPSVPLIQVAAAAPPGESCGVWLGAIDGAPRRSVSVSSPAGSGMLVLHSDLGALLRRTPQVVVEYEGRVTLMPSTVLALSRMLELLSRERPPELRTLPIGDGSAEEVLAREIAARRTVAGSRTRYGGR